ncbi:MAG: DNA-binding protein WhiA [Ruminococcus sp.]|nr:DNA-binding protein WhiA [Ruminococcus sp.]MBR0302290.1 DNA-binding protein WhiA [Clostridia bacterium]
MSFSYDTKKELSRVAVSDDYVLHSELYAMLLLSRKFTEQRIVFKTENKYTFARFTESLQKLFGVKMKLSYPPEGVSGKNKSYTAEVPNDADCQRIFSYYGHDREVSLRVNRANIGDEECQRSFIRGAFLACGSVTDPEKGYHLEFSIPYRNLCRDICLIIREIPDCEVSVKMLSRLGAYIAYVKDSEQITDLLAYMGAGNCAMEIMGTKALKQVRNSANRLANSEIANLEKTAAASANQLKAIHILKKNGRFNLLPDELKEVANLREEYPELSLRDIGERLSPKISRSGVNHRMEKLIRLSKEETP